LAHLIDDIYEDYSALLSQDKAFCCLQTFVRTITGNERGLLEYSGIVASLGRHKPYLEVVNNHQHDGQNRNPHILLENNIDNSWRESGS